MSIKGIAPNNQKRKFILSSFPDDLVNTNCNTKIHKSWFIFICYFQAFPRFQDFKVVHNYLMSTASNSQIRIRKRGQSGMRVWNSWFLHDRRRLISFLKTHGFTHIQFAHWLKTVKRLKQEDKSPNANTVYVDDICAGPINSFESWLFMLKMLLSSADDSHYTVYKLRRCFVWKRRAFHVDIFQEPCNQSCRDLILLETYCEKDHKLSLPDFLHIDEEVTDDQKYSMFNLSLKAEIN